MPTKARPSFAFLVVTYNHQKYILEHLESIKYLVQTHGTDIDVDLIINDDCSRDRTQTLVDQWLKINTKLFRHIKTLYNPKNLGTCASVNNMLAHMVADRCKLTAGDDVYSYENIFELSKSDLDVAMLSGRVLYLLDGMLANDIMANILTTATQVIYKNNTIFHRFKHFSYNNAPNLMYATDCLLHPRVREYLMRFDVVEDWPIQIAISKEFPDRRFTLIDKVFVYYRRTGGSTYIVANQRFVADKKLIYEDLIKTESAWLEKARLYSRKKCFELGNKWPVKFLNLDFYIFAISCAARSVSIIKKSLSVNMETHKHIEHYHRIKLAAKEINIHYT